MSDKVQIKLKLNNADLLEQVSPTLMLADFLQESKNLTATRVCCGIGVCRACTVAVKHSAQESFEATRACITPVVSLDGATIKTTEGLAEADQLHPLQEAFLKNFSFQCGYSTSGFLMGAYSLLDKLRLAPVSADKIDEAILEGVGDNICRCTGYLRYYTAIKEVILATPGLVLQS